MQRIELQKTPSQNFTVNLDEHNFELTLRDIGSAMLMDLNVDGKPLAYGLLVEPNQPVLPYPHLTEYGNFVLLQEGNDYPTWETIGVNSSLYYMTQAEQQEVANAG